MGSVSIAHEAEGNKLVKNIETKHLKLAKRGSAAIILVFKSRCFSLLVGYNI